MGVYVLRNRTLVLDYLFYFGYIWGMDKIPRYEIIDFEGDLKGGREARRYSDGSIRNERGHMLEPLPGKFYINKDNAAALAKRKHEKYRESFAAGVVSGAIARGFDVTTDSGAWEAVGQHAASVYFNTDNARALSALGRFIGESGGFVRDRHEKTGDQAESVARGVASGAVSALLAALRRGDS